MNSACITNTFFRSLNHNSITKQFNTMEEMNTKYEMTEQNKDLFFKIADKIEQGIAEDSELGYYIECECVFEKGALSEYIASCIRQGYTIGIEPSWTLFIR